MSVDTQYAYAVARIRAIEKRLLDKGKMDRMVEAKSAEEALKVLTEAGYGSGSAAREMSAVLEYEDMLKEEQKNTFRLLKDIAPEPEVFDLFLLRNDYHNIKVILKGEFLGQENNSIIMDTGSIPANKLKLMLKERRLSDMPATMRKAVAESIDVFNRTADPQVIDNILDMAYFRQLKDYTGSSDNRFMIGLIDIMADLTNIKIFLRAKKLGKSWEWLQKILMPGGRLDRKLFDDNIETNLEDFVQQLKYSPYGEICEEGIESYKNGGSLTRFEKLVDNYIISYIKKAKFISMGIEPLIGYLLAKENEIKNARIVMVGKINNIPAEIIKERLRETYV